MWFKINITILVYFLTVTLPLGAGAPEGKNFTCNVFIISTHFSPSEA